MHTKYSILIICEGEKTEPLYLGDIRDEVCSNNIWQDGVNIKISKEPLIDKPSKKKVKHKSNRTKRFLKETKKETIERKKIEEAYKGIPLRFVREAQMGIEDGTCDEAWAVFDHDNHPKRKEAFAHAAKTINGKNVNIAFSSRSVELWFLLHFELSKKIYLETECTIKTGGKKKPIGCNKTLGCKGQKCLWGRLRQNKVLENSKKNSHVYNDLKLLIGTAYVNAIKLRKWSLLNEENKPIYDRNPYTDFDHLVRRLFIPIEKVEWVYLNEVIEFENVKLSFEKSGNSIQLIIDNTINTNPGSYFLIRKGNIVIIDTQGSEIQFDVNKTVAVWQKVSINLPIPNNYNKNGSILCFKRPNHLIILDN